MVRVKAADLVETANAGTAGIVVIAKAGAAIAIVAVADVVRRAKAAGAMPRPMVRAAPLKVRDPLRPETIR